MDNNNLFVCEHFLPIFETQKLANFYGLSGGLQAVQVGDKDNIKTLMIVAERDYKIKVSFSNPGEIILKMDEVIELPFERIFWHVIVGEKVGWIVWKRDCVKQIKQEKVQE